jgi:UDP-2,3-diacylglucosamine hydrolase
MNLGLIAGNGRFPFLVLEAARAMGHDVTVIATKEEAFADLNEAAAKARAQIHWISLGELGKCISLLKQAGVSHAVMAGQVKHTKIFAGGIIPDAKFLSVLMTLPFRNTDGLIGAVAAVLKAEGVELIDSTSLLKPMLASAGVMTKRRPTDDEQKDFDFGYEMADAIAGLDIGQTIAVKHGAVVAVEAMEGTDEVIARAGQLASSGVRIIKVAKPKQDMRFDVPVVGLATVQAMRAKGASALSIDAGKTLMFERDEMIKSADEAGITIVGREKA